MTVANDIKGAEEQRKIHNPERKLRFPDARNPEGRRGSEGYVTCPATEGGRRGTAAGRVHPAFQLSQQLRGDEEDRGQEERGRQGGGGEGGLRKSGIRGKKGCVPRTTGKIARILLSIRLSMNGIVHTG